MTDAEETVIPRSITVLPYRLSFFEIAPKDLYACFPSIIATLFYSPRKHRFVNYCLTSIDSVSMVMDQWHADYLLRSVPSDYLMHNPAIWRAIKVTEGSDMSSFEVDSGLVTAVSGKLSKEGYSIFYLSQDSSDLVLVRETQLDAAMEVLKQSFSFELLDWHTLNPDADVEYEQETEPSIPDTTCVTSPTTSLPSGNEGGTGSALSLTRSSSDAPSSYSHEASINSLSPLPPLSSSTSSQYPSVSVASPFSESSTVAPLPLPEKLYPALPTISSESSTPSSSYIPIASSPAATTKSHAMQTHLLSTPMSPSAPRLAPITTPKLATTTTPAASFASPSPLSALPEELTSLNPNNIQSPLSSDRFLAVPGSSHSSALHATELSYPHPDDQLQLRLVPSTLYLLPFSSSDLPFITHRLQFVLLLRHIPSICAPCLPFPTSACVNNTALSLASAATSSVHSPVSSVPSSAPNTSSSVSPESNSSWKRSSFACYSEVDGDVSVLVDRNGLEILAYGNIAQVLGRNASHVSIPPNATPGSRRNVGIGLYGSGERVLRKGQARRKGVHENFESDESQVPEAIVRCRELFESTAKESAKAFEGDANGLEYKTEGMEDEGEEKNVDERGIVGKRLETRDKELDRWLATQAKKRAKAKAKANENSAATGENEMELDKIRGRNDDVNCEDGITDDEEDEEEDDMDVWNGRTWRALRLDGEWGFDETGLVYSLSEPVTEARICPLYLSTYRTDYMLVPEPESKHAITLLLRKFKVVPES